MTKPSEEWLNQYKKTILPEMFVTITYHVGDDVAQNDAAASAASQKEFSNVDAITNTKNRSISKYATGELNLWKLDGSFDLVPSSPQLYGDAGYVSYDCVTESSKATITISFSNVHTTTIPGLSIVWSKTMEEYAKSFKVTVYNGDSVVLSESVLNNESIETVVDCEISSYDSIVLEIYEWCIPWRCARVEQIELGQKVVFEKKDIFSYEHESKRDPISGQLSKESVSFSVNNNDQKWNPINPEGLYKYLYEQQRIETKYGMEHDGEIEWINGGTFYLSRWDVSSNSIQVAFEARDVFAFLMSSNYSGRKYGTLYEMCYDALESLITTGIDYSISEELKDYSTDITANGTSYKNSDILQLAANAAGMALYQTREGEVRIERVPMSIVTRSGIEEVSLLNSYSYPEVTFSSNIKDVSCSVNGETFVYPENSERTGATQSVSNALLCSDILKNNGQNALTESYSMLLNRRKVALDYRASPHNDAFDILKVNHQFGNSSNVLTTDIKYTFAGSFRGTLEGYIIESVSSLLIDKDNAFLDYLDHVDVTAKLTPSSSDSPAISWSASPSDVVSLNVLQNSGGTSVCRVTWNKKGTATVTASFSDLRQSFSVSCSASTISTMSEGKTFFIGTSSGAVEVILAKHNYESGLNGSGRTLVVYKDAVPLSVWNESGTNAYSGSTVDKFLQNTVYPAFGSVAKAAAAKTKFYYTPGNGNSTMTTLSRNVFLLSAAEINNIFSGYSSANTEGSLLPVWKAIANGYAVSASSSYQMTRTPNLDMKPWGFSSSTYNNLHKKTTFFLITGIGDYGEQFPIENRSAFEAVNVTSSTNVYGRPAFTVPSTMELNANGFLIDP